MMHALTREQVRDIDRRAVEEYGMHSLMLMENAGRGCADLLESIGISGLVVICCGRGNNGGDGYVVARHLDLRGYAVQVLRWDEPAQMSPDCRANFEIAQRGHIPIHLKTADRGGSLPEADWYVDALLGTGVRGAPRPPYDQVLGTLNAAPGQKFAIDIPSGLDSDTGEAAATTFRADVTCTFVAAKRGMLAAAAREYVGKIHVADIGVPRVLVNQYLS